MAEVYIKDMFLGEYFWQDAAVLGLAIVLDVTMGEPPAVLHPVVYMGKAVTLLERLAPKGPVAQLIYGLGIVVVVPGAFGAAGYFLIVALKALHPIAYIIVAGFLLKTCFAVRGLERAALAVKREMEAGELGRARTELTALVSRDTAHLSPPQVASAAVESVAENTTDSFVSPWLAFALLGLPGALAYRAINTLDSMIGYRGKYEYLGKASARLDDVLNFVPSRLAVLGIVVASLLGRHNARRALEAAGREGRSTASPNAGLTMAAMAGGLGVVLEKVGHYRLGSGLRTPGATDIRESVKVMWWVAAMVCCLALGILAVHHAIL